MHLKCYQNFKDKLLKMMNELLDGADKLIVFLWGLGGDSEVMGSEAAEVGSIADKDMVDSCQIVFELGGCIRCYLRQEETGLCLSGLDTWYLV